MTNAASNADLNGTGAFGSVWVAVMALRCPAVGASGFASNTTGMTFRPGSICSAVSVTPAGSFSKPIASGPPKSTRLAITSDAVRPPFGTVIVWRSWFAGLLPSTFGMVVSTRGATGVSSMR